MVAFNFMGNAGQYYSMIMNTIIYVGTAIAAIAGFFVVFYMSKLRLKYTIPITIFSIRKDGTQVITSDLAAMQRKKGEECLVLKKKGAILPPPPFDYGTLTEKGATHFYIIQTGINEFRYAKPNITDIDKIALSPDQRDILAWNVYAQDLMKNMFDMTSWLKKYAPYLVLMLVVAGSIVMFALISKNIKAAIDLGHLVVERAASLGAATIQQTPPAQAPPF